MQLKKVVYGGIPISILSSTRSNSALKLTGLFLLHGRLQSTDYIIKEWNEFIEKLLDDYPSLIIFAFDHRNHGQRLYDKIQNKGKDENPNHPNDMFAFQFGTAMDIKHLIDVLPLYIDNLCNFGVMGFSLGGHSTLLAVTLDTRLKFGISIVGCGDYLALMEKRNVVVSDKLLELLQRSDPINNTQKLINTHLLLINGGQDDLVQAEANERFAQQLALDIKKQGNGSLTSFVDPDAKHEFSLLMQSKCFTWFEQIYEKL